MKLSFHSIARYISEYSVNTPSMAAPSLDHEDGAETLVRQSLVAAEELLKRRRIDPELVRVAVHPPAHRTLVLLDRVRGGVPEQLWRALYNAEANQDSTELSGPVLMTQGSVQDETVPQNALEANSSRDDILPVTSADGCTLGNCIQQSSSTCCLLEQTSSMEEPTQRTHAKDPLAYGSWPQYLKDRLFPAHIPSAEELGSRRDQLGEGGLVVCLLRNCYRVTDNAALDMAIYLSSSLQADLNVIVIVESAMVDDALRTDGTGSASLRRQNRSFLQAVCSLFTELEKESITCIMIGTSGSGIVDTLSEICVSAQALVLDDAFIPGDHNTLAEVTQKFPNLPILMMECGCVPRLRSCPQGLCRSAQEYRKWWLSNIDSKSRNRSITRFDVPRNIRVPQLKFNGTIEIELISNLLSFNEMEIEFTESSAKANVSTLELSSSSGRSKALEDAILLQLSMGVLSPFDVLEKAPNLINELIEDDRCRGLCLENESILCEGTDSSKLNWMKIFEKTAANEKPNMSSDPKFLFPKVVIHGCTEDFAFNHLQRELVLTGRLPRGASLTYWIGFLMTSLPSWRIGVYHALMQVACHSLIPSRRYPRQCVKIILAAECAATWLKTEKMNELRDDVLMELQSP